MFHKMRRHGQMLSEEEIAAVLNRATSGVLAVTGMDGYPYAVPISYLYDGGKFYFHCAKSGHKLEAIEANNRVSFCVIDQDQIVPAEYTTYFRSVIAFGRIRVLEDAHEKRAAIEKLAVKYAPEESWEGMRAEVDRGWNALCMLEMTIDHMTGKEAIELVRSKREEIRKA